MAYRQGRIPLSSTSAVGISVVRNHEAPAPTHPGVIIEREPQDADRLSPIARMFLPLQHPLLGSFPKSRLLHIANYQRSRAKLRQLVWGISQFSPGDAYVGNSLKRHSLSYSVC